MNLTTAVNNFMQAIATLKEKGYPVIGWGFPNEKNNMVAIVFTNLCVPATLPPQFIKTILHEEEAVAFGRAFNTCPNIYADHVKRSSRAVLKWAKDLPECPVDMPKIKLFINL